MGSFSLSHLFLIVAAFLILFGAGRLPRLMSDLAKGLKAFREGMQDTEIKNPKEASANDSSSPSLSPQSPTDLSK